MTHKQVNKYFKIKKSLIAAVKEIEKKWKIIMVKSYYFKVRNFLGSAQRVILENGRQGMVP